MDLFEALDKYRHAEFAWGEMDCCLFVANVLRDLYGRDYAEPWRGSYDSERGALRLISRHGGVQGLATEAFGPMRGMVNARRGSVALVGPPWADPDAIGELLGIVDGGGIVCLTDKGFIRVPMSAGLGCWTVSGE